MIYLDFYQSKLSLSYIRIRKTIFCQRILLAITHRSIDSRLRQQLLVGLQFDLDARVAAVALVPPVRFSFPPLFARSPYQRTEPVMVTRLLRLCRRWWRQNWPILTSSVQAHSAVHYQMMRVIAIATTGATA